MLPQRLRIAIDGRYPPHSHIDGMNTYLRNLGTALARHETGHRFVFWLDQKTPFELAPAGSQIETREFPWHSPLSGVRNDLRIGKAMMRDQSDLAHFPANYGFTPSWLPTLITIHDATSVLPIREIVQGHPGKSSMMMTYLHLATRRAIRDQPFVVTVSRYSRDEILNHVDLDPGRIFVAPSAHEQVFRPLESSDVERIREQHALRERVILADATKNPDCVLRSYRALPSEIQDKTSLVFFSRRAAPEPVQRSADAGESVVFIRPDTDTLVGLYNVADVFVFPSWYEGFGLPVLEAMACGTPVIASSRGSLPEVLGDAGFVVDAEDHDAIAAIVSRLFTEELNQASLRAHAISRASEFSWDKTAGQMVDIYQEVYDRSRGATKAQERKTAAVA